MFKLKPLIVLTIVWSIFLTCSVNAALIDNGIYTTDTDSGLDWLDFTQTQELSFNYVSTQFQAGGLYEGWQFANYSQVNELFNNAGGSGVYDGKYDPNSHNNAASLLLDLMGATSPPNTVYRVAAVHFYGDFIPELAGIYIREWASDSHFDILEIREAMFATGEAEIGTGLALVRATAVPEPTTVPLLLLSLVGVIRGRQVFRKPITSASSRC